MTQTWLKLPKMSHEEWLNWRRGGIGGSDAPAIMGVSPWSTPFTKYEEKVVGRTEEDNASKAYGRASEASVRFEFEELMNTSLSTANIERTDKPWLKASLDGIDNAGTLAVEIKKANRDDHFVAINKKVPEKYYPQCQHILNVLGLPGMYYVSSPSSGSLVIVEVARDDQYIQNELLPAEQQFWEGVLNKRPPELTERDYLNMQDNPLWADIAKKWKETSQQLKTYEAQERQLREQLIALSKDRCSKGSDLNLIKSICQGAVDYKQAIKDYLDNLRQHYPEIPLPEVPIEPYRKPSFIKWTIRAT